MVSLDALSLFDVGADLVYRFRDKLPALKTAEVFQGRQLWLSASEKLRETVASNSLTLYKIESATARALSLMQCQSLRLGDPSR